MFVVLEGGERVGEEEEEEGGVEVEREREREREREIFFFLSLALEVEGERQKNGGKKIENNCARSLARRPPPPRSLSSLPSSPYCALP